MPLLYYLLFLPCSKLPFWLLYVISDFLYLILYRLVGYRKKVIRGNIDNSFPNLSAAEKNKIENQFYHHFCDLIVESIKAFSISEKEIEKRVKHINTEIIKKYFDQGKDVTMVGGHYNNWELYAVSVAMHISHRPVALFTPMANQFMNHKITASRSKYGLWMKSYGEVKEIMQNEKREKVAVIFGSDQCPKRSQKPYWMEFLNQETGVQFGAEKFARDYNTPVIYGVINKLKHGYYEVEYKLVCENPSELPLGQITETHTKFLEEDILKDPGYWLWSHKRWKRKRADFEN